MDGCTSLVGNRYRVGEELGRGASSVVVAATDSWRQERPVALKILHRQAAEAGLEQHLRREFAHLYQLRHPHLLQVHACGNIGQKSILPECDAGAFYIVEERVSGQSAHAWSKGKSPATLATVGAQMAAALACLHERGISHGDLKPDNILIAPGPKAQLLDFGLSARKAAPDISGTPRFMAPEALEGAAGRPSDVYSLGITIATLLHGAPPEGDWGQQLHDPHYGGLLQGMTHPDPERRTTPAAAFEQFLAFAAPEDAPSLKALQDHSLHPGASAIHRPSVRQYTRLPRPALSEGTLRGVLTGAPGSGKSTLGHHIVSEAVLAGFHCPDSLRPGGDGREDRILQLFFELGLSPPSALTPQNQWQRFATWAEILHRYCATRPLALIWDDVPEGSPLSEFGAFLERLNAQSPNLLWVESRVDSPDSTTALPPLEAHDVRALLEAARPLRPTDNQCAEALHIATGGNPGHILHLLQKRPGAQLLDTCQRGALKHHLLPHDAGLLPQQALPDSAWRWLKMLSLCDDPLHLSDAENMPSEVFGPGLEHLLDAQLVTLENSPSGPSLLLTSPALKRTLAEDTNDETAQALLHHLPDTEAYAATRGSLSKRLKLYPQSAALLLRGAIHRAATARPAEAFQLYSQVLVCPELPDDDQARAQRGAATLASQLGLFAEALPLFQAGLPHPDAEIGYAETLLKLGRYKDAVTQMESLRKASESIPLRADPLQARACLFSGALDQAADIIQAAKATKGHPHLVQLLATEGLVHFYRGDLTQAEALLRESYRVGSVPEDSVDHELDATRGNLAMVLQKAGQLDAAETIYQESLTLAREQHNLPKQVTRLSNLGTLQQEKGELEAALQTYAEARTLSEVIKGEREGIYIILNRANLQSFLGQSAQAIGDVIPAIEKCEAMGMKTEWAYLHLLLAELCLNEENPEKAREAQGKAATLFAETSHQAGLAEALIAEAQIAVYDAQPGQAITNATQAVKLAQSLNRPRILAQACLWQVLASLQAPSDADPDQGLEAVSRLLQEDLRHQYPDLLWIGHAAKGILLTREGDAEGSAHALAQARSFADRFLKQLPGASEQSYATLWYRRPLWNTVATNSGEEMELITKNVDKLLAINRELTRDHNPTRLLERIIDAAIALSGAERGFIILRQEGDEAFSIPTARNIARESLQTEHLEFSHSIARRAIESTGPVTIMDALGDERFSEFTSVHHLQLRSVLCLPLHAPPHIEGALYLDDRRRINAFSQADVAMLSAFGDQAAIALSNARLVEQLQRKSDALEESRELIEELNQRLQQELSAQSDELEHIRARHRAEESPEGTGKHGMIGTSRAMREIYRVIERVSDKDVCVTILGESGTGKELVARGIHSASSRQGQFVSVNCGAITPQLWESELFGHEKGSFTGAVRAKPGLFEVAQDGTLFLDEVGEMPLDMQVKLLRVLQQKEFRRVGGTRILTSNARIVCATNRDLEEMVREGLFREDLWYRINVVEVTLASLRERREDLPLLIEHFIDRLGGTNPPELSRQALATLLDHDWPGNIRELENEVQRALVLCDEVITAEDFSAKLRPSSRAPDLSSTMGSLDGSLKEQVASFEKQLILRSLQNHQQKVAHSAKSLGLTRAGLYKKISKYDIVVNR
ncbi:MAG: sigma 54-interacting transcriptional regulator [Myxococcota bacterium]|nr:sigma 54-interacting transcriptional regulator [Myxococcota bacterium]